MKQDTPTSSNVDKAKRQVAKGTPDGIVEQIARQMDVADEAHRRIQEEGIVVRDMKGSVIQHPAIKIEQDAAKLIADLISRNKAMF